MFTSIKCTGYQKIDYHPNTFMAGGDKFSRNIHEIFEIKRYREN